MSSNRDSSFSVGFFTMEIDFDFNSSPFSVSLARGGRVETRKYAARRFIEATQRF